jgi:outer membrane protein
MIKRFACVTVVVAFGLSFFALAQADPAKATTTKIGTINIEQAIYASNEGRRDFETLDKKFLPKQNELKTLADEIDSFKKQLNTQQDKLNDESRGTLVKQIELKQKSLERATQDAQEDFQNQRGELVNRILTKMGPLIQKYFTENGYSLLLDTSQPWPQGPVVMSGPATDITQPIVEAYNMQSGVPAPAMGSTPTKSGRPAPTKPAAPPSSTPPK